jgi:vitamin B12 transporter
MLCILGKLAVMIAEILHIAAFFLTGDSSLRVPYTEPITPGDTVFIKAERHDFATVGRKQKKITQSESPQTLSQNLAGSAQFLKEYGISGSATVSKRGADASQTQTLWNGLPINHPMLGMMDFNAISAYGMDELITIEGGNAAMYGSGSVGGTIILNNQIKFGNVQRINAVSEYNSLNNIQSGFQIQKAWERTYLDFTYSLISKENRFDFYDPIMEKLRSTKNLDLTLQNLRAVLGQKYKNQQFKWVIERSNTSRGLGFLLGSEQLLGQQFDVHWRMLFQHDFEKKGWHFTQKLGNINDQLIFIPQGQGPDTSTAKMYFLQSECYRFTPWGKHLFGLDYQIQQGYTQFYSGQQTRHLPALFYAFKGNWNKTSISMNARYEFNENVITGGIGTQTNLNSNWKWKTDLHRSFRRPTLNDLYWFVPTRKTVSSETGWSAECGILWQQINKGLEFQWELTPFYRELQNPIIWLPQGAFWSAQNLYFGRYMGVQMSAQINLRWGNHQFKLEEELEWVRTQVQSQEASLPVHQIFIPDIMSSTSAQWAWKSWGANVQIQHTGNRYIATDNSDWMPMYTLISAEMNKQIFWTLKERQMPFYLSFGIQNLTDQTYQNMPGRPMPPRNIFVRIKNNF